MAPKLFYVFGHEGSWNSLEYMQKKYLYTKAVDAYSVGVLKSLIWNEEWDRTLLLDAMVFHGFFIEIERLLRQRPTYKVIHSRCFEAVHISSF